MNRRISKKMEQSSVELSMSNGIINNQSNWSRCNSFSSSSSDSTLYCSNSSQHSNFSDRKRLRKDDSIGKIVKRSRNSSGSSASSNVSCMSDKDINPPEQVSHEINTAKTLDDISPSTFQHKAFISSGLSLDMNTMLPFHHNLRRNIRKKTCSCDCTATCTTVVISRKYKEISEETVEEKTVISRTKVKTFVDSHDAPIRQVQMSSKVSFQENMTRENECSFQENMTHKSEYNRKRRSEIERLYESLHEIKWAKNFSPDNILRQFDVRQAATCSAFGKISGEKHAKSDFKTNKSSKTSGQIYAKMSNESSDHIRMNKSSFGRCNKSYSTRSKIHSLINFENKLQDEDSSPPVLEKSILTTADKALDIDFPNYDTYPLLSKEVLTPEKETNNIKNIADLSSSTCNAIQSDCSVISFDVNLQHNIDNRISEIVDCSSTFFDIADDIHSIDACFKEVGAEVVVSTSCDNNFQNLPLLTAVEDSSNVKSIKVNPHDCPPVLEHCESSSSYNLPQKNSLTHCTSKVKSFCPDESLKKFFPPVNSLFIYDEDYSLKLSFLEDCKRNYSVDNRSYAFMDRCKKIFTPQDNCEKSFEVGQSFCDINEVNITLESVGENMNEEHPILESCISDSISNVNFKSKICITGNIKSKDIDENANNSLSDEANLLINKTNNFLIKSENINQVCKSIKCRLKSKSLIFSLGRRIVKKYVKIITSKSEKQCKIVEMCNKRLNSSVNSHKALPTSDGKNGSSLIIPLSVINSAQMPLSVGIIKSPMFPCSPPSQITETLVNRKCISSSVSCLQSTAPVANAKCATVTESFNQKLYFAASQENITLNQVKDSSQLFQADKTLCLNNKQSKKPSPNNIFKNHNSENYADIPGYSKILLASKKKEQHSDETVKVPPRVFTCHFQTINVTRDNDYIQIVLKITRGKSIFLTHETLVELKEAINKAGNDKDCRLLILNGFGQTFCLGLDVRPIVEDHKNEVVGNIANAVKDLISTLADFQKPLFAIVNGAAYGLGLTILNHADVTLATSNASFCMPYSRLGYMPEGGATLTLPQAVGTTVAMDLILRGQVITAEQARDIGLVNEVVEVRHLPQDLVSRVKAIAQNSSPSVQATKSMIKMRLHIQLPLVLETEAKLLPRMWLSPSCQEAIQSALDSGFFEDC